jgi:hypothetical protein
MLIKQTMMNWMKMGNNFVGFITGMSECRSLSDLGLIDCGKAGFGQIYLSFSLNSYGYSPQTIETAFLQAKSLPKTFQCIPQESVSVA